MDLTSDTPAPPLLRKACCVCGSDSSPRVATLPGTRTQRDFALRYCAGCGFAWVENPWTDFATVYDEAYYLGKGSDPLVNYVDELTNPHTIRRLEWRGILQWADDTRAALAGNRGNPGAPLRWLDFGCGNGGLVRHVQSAGADRWEIDGFEEGWAAGFGRQNGIGILTREELDAKRGTYDLVTAIEVLEHTVDPHETLREIRAMLRPGGRFLFTTGNLAPYTSNIPAWGYVRPEIHVSYYEPRSLARLLSETGFEPLPAAYAPGHTSIIAYKVLKNLRLNTLSYWMHLVPWPVLSRILNAKMGIFAHPTAVAK
ncbi:hypothetical protein DB346_21310 [Verrucomicrobia bacterium LW23]|nr:hypothetical protein DB346_21310 [Verrucomicrobia bacterium LW23]